MGIPRIANGANKSISCLMGAECNESKRLDLCEKPYYLSNLYHYKVNLHYCKLIQKKYCLKLIFYILSQYTQFSYLVARSFQVFKNKFLFWI